MTLITFSGLDGAGKSTLVDWLRDELRARDRRVTVLHQNDHIGVFAIARALRDRLTGRRPAPDAPPRMTPRPTRIGRLRDAVIWSVMFRRLLYPVDLLLFAICRAWVERACGRVLLMDRYFYDTIVDFAARRGPPREFGWLRITPRPDLAVLLDISPEEAFARKSEYTVEYLARRSTAYRDLFRRIPCAIRIAATSRESVRETVRMAVARCCP